jgi:ATP-dependent Clp protease ATP-binding subunit ClpA
VSPPFNLESEEIIRLAKAYAAGRGDDRVNTGDLLAALIGEPSVKMAGIIRTFFSERGITPQTLAELHGGHYSGEIEQFADGAAASQEVTDAMDYAAIESLNCHEDSIGPQHILLGLIRLGRGHAALELERRQITLKSARTSIERIIRSLNASHGIEVSSEIESSEPIEFLIDPGTATASEIADLLFEISKLYRMIGGPGINFRVTDCRQPQEAGELI